MWEFFFTKPAGCLLQSYSGECKAIIHVILFFMALGSLLSRARPSEQVHCWAETLKPGGVHGELIPCSLQSTAGPGAAHHKGRGFVRWLSMNRLPGRISMRSECYSSILHSRGKGWQCSISPPRRNTHQAGSLFQEGEQNLCHGHCIEVRDKGRADFTQDKPEGLGHSPLLHTSIPGTTTADNSDGKASKCAKDEANQKIEKSPWEDSMLSGSSMVGLSAIAIAMWEAKELHSWEINISSLQTNKKKSMKTLNWNIYGDQHSQLSGWAQLGLRRPELHFWQSHWSLSERGTRCFPALCINFLSCEMGPVIQISYKIYWWKIWRKNWYSLFFPTQTQAVMLFPNILSNKENTILFHECWYV